MKYGIWNVTEPGSGAVNALVQGGYTPLAAMVLASRGIRDPKEARAQVDCSFAEAGMGTGRIRSETLGDRSVTYAEETAGEVRVNGIPTAPQALLLLGNAGCLSRWV